jgi:hypothetical protein
MPTAGSRGFDRSHADFAATRPISGDIVIDSTHLSVAEVAARARSVLDAPPASSRAGHRPLFRDIDCLEMPVPDLEVGLAFYRDALGHQLIWRTDTAAGLRLAGEAAELVLQTERAELDANLRLSRLMPRPASSWPPGERWWLHRSTSR